MKVPKSLLQTIAVALAVTTVGTSCIKEEPKPKDKKKEEQKEPYNCPACGMG